MSDLINESEESLPCQPLTNPYILNSTDWTQESCYFRNQDSISAHPFKLDQTLSFESPIDILASYPFLKLKLNMKVILNLKFVILFHFLTQLQYLYQIFFSILESTLNPVLVHHEIESQISYNHTPLMKKVSEH